MDKIKRFTTQIISQKRFTLTFFGFAITATWNLVLRISKIALTATMQLIQNTPITIYIPKVLMTVVTSLIMSFATTLKVSKVTIVATMRQVMSFGQTLNIIRPTITAIMHLIWRMDSMTLAIPKIVITANAVVATFRVLSITATSISGLSNEKVLEDWSATDLITMSYTLS